jgi:hypothetical protein
VGTTLIIVEELVIGFQVLAWVGLLVGIEWVACWELGNWIPVVGVLLLAAAYTLGIVFDRFLGVCSSWVLDTEWKWIQPITDKLREWLKYHKDDTKTITETALDIMLRYPPAQRHLENRERQKCLLRATGFNSLLFVVAWGINSLLSVLGGWTRPMVPLPVVIAVTVVMPFAFLTWLGFSRDFNSGLTDLRNHAKEDKNVTNSPK